MREKNIFIIQIFSRYRLRYSKSDTWLATEAVGLGTVMLGIAPLKERMDAAAKILNLPENMVAFTYFPIGYPAEKPVHKKERFEQDRIHIIE